MAGSYITIQEAAAISGKSVQTIRRAIKAKKLLSRRKKTPQGFNYLVERESVVDAYKLRMLREDRKRGGLNKGGRAVSQEFATVDDLKKIQSDISTLLDENEKAKESFMRFMKTFQEKFVIMENQLKLLEEPKNKRWYQFWK